MKEIGILFHTDLDGFYSAVCLYKDNFNSNQVGLEPIEYGMDLSYQLERYKRFIVLDFAENVGGKKTILWADHHLRDSENSEAETTIVEEALSCVSLLVNKKIIKLDQKAVDFIDIVDSANYDFNGYRKEDVLLPGTNFELGKYILLNQLLRRNRKTNLVKRLAYSKTLDIDEMLERIEKDRDPAVIKKDRYFQSKIKLMENLFADKEKYIKIIDKIPILFTKHFSHQDWRGYDPNLLGYLEQSSPYLINFFEFNEEISVQVYSNSFYKNFYLPITSVVENEFESLRGHSNILNFRFSDKEEALNTVNKIVSKLSSIL